MWYLLLFRFLIEPDNKYMPFSQFGKSQEVE